MATGRTSERSEQRVEALPVLPAGVIPRPRAESDAPLVVAAPGAPRRVLWLAVSAVLALALVGAGIAAFVSTRPGAPPATAAVSAVPRSAEDVGFLKTVRQQPGFAAISDDSLVKIGKMLCGRLEAGADPNAIAMGNANAKLSVEDVSTAVGAAAGAYCPDQMARVGTPG